MSFTSFSHRENILTEWSTSFGHSKFRLRQNRVASGGLFSARIFSQFGLLAFTIVISDLGKIKWLLVPSFGENILAEQSTSFGHSKFRLRQNKVAFGPPFL